MKEGIMGKNLILTKSKNHEYSNDVKAGWTWTTWIVMILVLIVIIIFLACIIYFFWPGGDDAAAAAAGVACLTDSAGSGSLDSGSFDMCESYNKHEIPAETMSGE
jgi:hypothetical protein